MVLGSAPIWWQQPGAHRGDGLNLYLLFLWPLTLSCLFSDLEDSSSIEGNNPWVSWSALHRCPPASGITPITLPFLDSTYIFSVIVCFSNLVTSLPRFASQNIMEQDTLVPRFWGSLLSLNWSPSSSTQGLRAQTTFPSSPTLPVPVPLTHLRLHSAHYFPEVPFVHPTNNYPVAPICQAAGETLGTRMSKISMLPSRTSDCGDSSENKSR